MTTIEIMNTILPVLVPILAMSAMAAVPCYLFSLGKGNKSWRYLGFAIPLLVLLTVGFDGQVLIATAAIELGQLAIIASLSLIEYGVRRFWPKKRQASVS